MKKYNIEISVNNANNVIITKVIDANNHDDAMNKAEKLARTYFNKGLETWFKAEQIR